MVRYRCWSCLALFRVPPEAPPRWRVTAAGFPDDPAHWVRHTPGETGLGLCHSCSTANAAMLRTLDRLVTADVTTEED